MARPKAKYFAIAQGKECGIFRGSWEADGIRDLVANYPGTIYKSFSKVEDAEKYLKCKCDCKETALDMIHASEERNYKIPQRSHADTSPEPSKSKSFGLASMLNVLTTPFRASQEDTSAQVTGKSARSLNLIHESHEESLEPEVYCLENCPKDGLEDEDMVECSLCRRWIHFQCGEATAEDDIQGFWVCPDCKGLPKTVKYLKSELKSSNTEVQELKIHIGQLQETIRDMITNLKGIQTLTNRVSDLEQTIKDGPNLEPQKQKGSHVEPHTSASVPTSRVEEDPNNDYTKVLLIGDSNLKYINPRGLHETTVHTRPGRRITDIARELDETDLQPYSHIVVHAGTNNLSEKDDENDITTIGKEAEVLCSTIRNKQPTAKIVISGICPRADRVLPATKVEPANTALRRVAEENRALFVDNEGSFQYRNGRLNTTLYDKDLLHINRKRGASRLIANICEVVPTILPTTRPPANKQWDLLANRSPLYGAGPPPVPRSPDGGTRHTQRPRQQYTGESTRRNAHAEPMQHHMQHHNSMHMQNQWQWYPDSTRREQRPRWIAGEPPCHFCWEPGHITHVCRHGGPIRCKTCNQLGHKAKLCYL
ncbi:Hypp591 [Branchiostoma lanceolatum]|uniref:1-alkyl-2-acetylglycerophosphocholine esterase n=1 Tax=Branchiostoma lanceolatum TaxID=7740 RepID=A0A8J9YQ81_BRALA|nr:Hypp591 [Branchiostoma lanceolatum]